MARRIVVGVNKMMAELSYHFHHNGKSGVEDWQKFAGPHKKLAMDVKHLRSQGELLEAKLLVEKCFACLRNPFMSLMYSGILDALGLSSYDENDLPGALRNFEQARYYADKSLGRFGDAWWDFEAAATTFRVIKHQGDAYSHVRSPSQKVRTHSAIRCEERYVAADMLFDERISGGKGVSTDSAITSYRERGDMYVNWAKHMARQALKGPVKLTPKEANARLSHALNVVDVGVAYMVVGRQLADQKGDEIPDFRGLNDSYMAKAADIRMYIEKMRSGFEDN